MIERLLAGDAALEAGQLEVAARLFSQVTAADPRNAMAVVGLARVAMRRGDRAEARDLAGRALEIDPHEAVARRLVEELDAPTPSERGAAESDQVPAGAAPAATAPAAAPGKSSRSWWRRLLARIVGGG